VQKYIKSLNINYNKQANLIDEFDIFLINTQNNQKEKFNTIEKDIVYMYVCGITPYDYSHLGHARCYISFDILYRLLIFLGYKVYYCRNFTDIDDKLIKKSIEKYNDSSYFKLIADNFIQLYKNDMNRLNCLEPTYQPRVTENIEDIISFIQKLIDKKHAYKINNDVYFDISSFRDYGKLSSKNIEDLQAGSRVAINDEKRNPLDFALWKNEKNGPGWQSPWGIGRPGWHIECSTLVKKYLKDNIDIHAGGIDLIFPHHENEIAQSESLNNKKFVNYWLHNGFININKNKMSKSLNNYITIKDILEKYDPEILRYWIINHNYRIPIEFSFDSLDQIKKNYNKIVKIMSNIEDINIDNFIDQIKEKKFPIFNMLINAICDDLNIAKFFGIFFEKIKEIETNKIELSLIKNIIKNILGLNLKILENKEVIIDDNIKKLIEEREIARREKNWTKADLIREKLKNLGYIVKDNKIE